MLRLNERLNTLEQEDLSLQKHQNESEILEKINKRLEILQEEEKLLKLGKLGRYAELRKTREGSDNSFDKGSSKSVLSSDMGRGDGNLKMASNPAIHLPISKHVRTNRI